MTIAARPRVSTLSGRVSRASVGKTSALRTPISSAAPSAAPTPSSVNRSRSWAKIRRTTASTTTTTTERRSVSTGFELPSDAGLASMGMENYPASPGGEGRPAAGPEGSADSVVVQKHEPTAAGDPAGRRHRGRQRAAALSDLPAADADRLALHRDLRRRFGGGPGQPARAADAARGGDRARLPGPGPDPDSGSARSSSRRR